MEGAVRVRRVRLRRGRGRGRGGEERGGRGGGRGRGGEEVGGRGRGSVEVEGRGVLLCLVLESVRRYPHHQVALLQVIEEACGDIDQASYQAWIRHSRRYFPQCLGLEDIACDVDEILWPDPER